MNDDLNIDLDDVVLVMSKPDGWAVELMHPDTMDSVIISTHDTMGAADAAASFVKEIINYCIAVA